MTTTSTPTATRKPDHAEAASRVGAQMVRETAITHGVCVRPVMQRRIDTVTGAEQLVPIACGSTRERVCPTCADANRRLRMAQCREGWHLDEEPSTDEATDDATEDVDVDEDQVDSDDEDDDWEDPDERRSRRVRSTRRREDVPELPKLPVADRTIGRTFTGNGGRTYRPSMFVTNTLASYGPVRSDGTPANPQSYDYRRAALDAMHFPKLVDRLWQNLRRVVGYNVQYFACVEAQKRLAPHLHAAIRGVFPRKLYKQVVAATYHQIWWPHFDQPVYTGTRLPVWDERRETYVDPETGVPLSTWDQAMRRIDDDLDAAPAHVLWFGTQTDARGLIGDTAEVGRKVGYLTKYLTKSIADTHADDDQASGRQRAHIDRLHEQVRWLPCSERCWNWLRYGIQPHQAEPGQNPGACPANAHARENLGCGGRRILVSKRWTGKTLSEHKADRRNAVEQVLTAAGIEMPEADRCSATTRTPDGSPRFRWEPLKPTETEAPSYREAILHAVDERRRWRSQYEHAKATVEAQREGVGCSATGPTDATPSGGEAA